MSSITYPHADRDEAATSYAQNVGYAFRSLLAALLAVKAQPPVSQRVKLRDQLAVFRLAREYETLSPNLAAELRFIASRG
nr:hypothetical protein [uncultured Noviherbaspirillum sp.]